MAGASRVLVLHDTTDGAYGGQRKGLGRLAGSLPGFLAHVSLAVAGDGTLRPLGALNVYCWARTNEPKSKKSKNGRKLSGADYAKREDKESERWMEAVRLCRERADAHQLVLHIADREGDNFVFLATMSVAGDRFVVRLAHNRAVGAEVVAGEQDLLRDVLEVAPVRAVRQVTLSRRLGNAAPGSQATHQPREQREVTLEIRATTVALQRPRYVDASLPRYLPVHVVYVTEVNAPADVEPVEWMLVTSEPIDTVEEILQVVDDYRARWLIEISHPDCASRRTSLIHGRAVSPYVRAIRASGRRAARAAAPAPCRRQTAPTVDAARRAGGPAPSRGTATHTARSSAWRARQRGLRAAIRDDGAAFVVAGDACSARRDGAARRIPAPSAR
jgi:hypothetical protein